MSPRASNPVLPVTIVCAAALLAMLILWPGAWLSKTASWLTGYRVVFGEAKFVSWNRVRFAMMTVSDSKGVLATGRSGYASRDPQAWHVDIDELTVADRLKSFAPDLSRFAAAEESAGIVLRESAWRLRQNPHHGWNVRMIRGQFRGVSAQLGMDLKEGGSYKVHAMLRIPERSFLSAYSPLFRERLARDRDNRWLWKASFLSNGRMTLWGRSARMLEATWK